MAQRIDYQKAARNGIRIMYEMERYIMGCGLEQSLIDLVKVRASQINGCAFCLDMHTKDARAEGETEQRLYALSAWRETPFFTERERAALDWTEKLTLISTNDVPESLYEAVREHFSEEELVNLTLAVNAINSWNRMAISMRVVPGSYQRKPARVD